MKRCCLFLFLTFFLIFGQARGSDQKLVHGAGTLPHLTSAVTLSAGLVIPQPSIYALGYNIGLGNRVQLGLFACILGIYNTIEINSLFNVLKTANDANFLSLYFNPNISQILIFDNFTSFTLRTGIAYEHRFGDKRRIGLYVKLGTQILLGVMDGNDFLPAGFSRNDIMIDCRPGFQVLLGKRFSLTLEPMLLYFYASPEDLLTGGQTSLSWAFESKRKSRL
jgi:hypothetical protein